MVKNIWGSENVHPILFSGIALIISISGID